jgi:hypothetical protein
MSIIEKYKWYQMGIVKKYVSEKMQMFFKTIPTEEQLIRIDEMIQEDKNQWIIACWLMFILGALLSGILVYSLIQLKYLLGLPIF